MTKKIYQLLILLMGLLTSMGLWADGIAFGEPEIRVEKGIYTLDVEQKYVLNDTLTEALENGVPLVFKTHVEIAPEGGWFWQKKQLSTDLRYVLRYRPLAAVYEVFPMGSKVKRTFATRVSALSALGEIRNMQLIKADLIGPDQNYYLTMQSELEISALPLPLRPQAYVSIDWHFDSGVHEWPL